MAGRRRLGIWAVFAGILMVVGCGDGGDKGSGPSPMIPSDTVVSLNLVTGMWWTQVTVDTVIQVKDSANRVNRTETFRTTSSRITVADVRPGATGGMDYTLLIVDTVQGASGVTVDSNVVVLHYEGGTARAVVSYGTSPLSDTLWYTYYQFPLTTGSSWVSCHKSRDTVVSYSIGSFALRLAVHGSATGRTESAGAMKTYPFADSLRACFDLVTGDTVSVVTEVDSTILGYQKGYDIVTYVRYDTRTELFSTEFAIPLYRRTVSIGRGTTYEFFGVVQPGQTYDTTRSVVRVTALYDPRWSPPDTLSD